MMKLEMEKNMGRGETQSNKRTPYRPNWNGAMINTSTFIFGADIQTFTMNEEMLTAEDILNCLTFSDRTSKNITITFSKDFLRRILKSHIHNLIENKII